MNNIKEYDIELAREAMAEFMVWDETVQEYKKAIANIQDLTDEEIQEIEPQLAKARENRQEYIEIAEVELSIYRESKRV